MYYFLNAFIGVLFLCHKKGNYDMIKQFYSVSDLATLCNVNTATIRRKINHCISMGILPSHIKDGTSIMLNLKQVLIFLEKDYSVVYHTIKADLEGYDHGKGSITMFRPALSKGKLQRTSTGQYLIRGFVLCLDVDGKPINYQNERTFDTKEEAERKRNELIERRAQGEFLSVADEVARHKENKEKARQQETFIDYMVDFINNTGDRAPKTLKDYNGIIKNQLQPYFKATLIDELTLEHIQKFAKSLTGKACIDKARLILNMTLDNLVGSGRISAFPYDKVKYPRYEGKGSKPKQPLTKEEIGLLLGYYKGHRLEHFIHLLFCTGMRIGEALALTWDDITINEDNSIVVDVSKSWGLTDCGMGTKDTKNINSVRTSYIPPTPILANLLQSAKDNAKCKYIAPNKANTAPIDSNNFRKRNLQDVAKKLGIEKNVTTHTARHSYISQAIAQHVPPALVANQVGHVDITMINKVYAKNVTDTAEAFRNFSIV